MSVIVTDAGFGPGDDLAGRQPAPVPLADVAANEALPAAILVAPGDDPGVLAGRLDQVALIVVAFPSFADGRGFTHAQALRTMGFRGRLRATGHVISDQYAMARRSGFDEVEISDDLAARQPEPEWLARADWSAHDYQTRLRQPA